MKRSSTSFQILKLNKPDKTEDTSKLESGLDHPVLVSFPSNMPSSSQLAQMKFNMYQEKNRDGAPKKIKKRVLKSAYKALKYEASSLNADIKEKAQACDYYIGVFDSAKNKCYALPVDSAYQMS